MKTTLLMFLLVASQSAFSAANCTDKPKAEWMKEEDFKKMAIAEGYEISKFKQPGSCYEIYGKNKEGKKVEVYFNPVDGKPTKTKMLK